MSKLPFRREIVRGVVLAGILLTGLVAAIVLYHSPGASAEPVRPAAPAVSAVEESVVTPEVKAEPAVVPPPPPIAPKGSRPVKSAIPQAPAVHAAIHEEEAAPLPPPVLLEAPAVAPSEERVEEKPEAAPAAPEVAQAPAEPAVQPAKPRQENRGIRWIKSLGRRLHIGR